MLNVMNDRMRVLLPLLAAMLLPAAGAGKDKPKDEIVILRGVIMDSQCAFNVHSDGHSHDLMTKGSIRGTSDEESCTQHCVKDMGGSYVLLVKKEVYKLEDQVKPGPFAGRKVKVTGSLNLSSNTLHNFEIEVDK